MEILDVREQLEETIDENDVKAIKNECEGKVNIYLTNIFKLYKLLSLLKFNFLLI